MHVLHFVPTILPRNWGGTAARRARAVAPVLDRPRRQWRGSMGAVGVIGDGCSFTWGLPQGRVLLCTVSECAGTGRYSQALHSRALTGELDTLSGSPRAE